MWSLVCTILGLVFLCGGATLHWVRGDSPRLERKYIILNDLLYAFGGIALTLGLLLHFKPAEASTPQEDSACYRACVECRVRCKQRSSDAASCQETCLLMKSACCESCGTGPGPHTTCSCT
jgi:hypothetical protein